MKINKILVVMLFFVGSASLAYFWEDFGRRSTPEERIEKRELDLKYEEKQAHVQQKKADVATQARKKQEDLNYKQSQLELQRKRNRLKLER